MTPLLALASSVLFGLGDFGGGLATRRFAPLRVVAWSQLLGAPVLAVGLLVVPAPTAGWVDLAWGAGGGLAGLAGLVLLYGALAGGTMSLVAPITGAVAAAVPVAVDILGGTRLSGLQVGGVVIALAAIVLLSGSGRGSLSPALAGRAVAAGLGFATVLVALAQTDVGSGAWPLVGARAVSIPLAFLLASRVAGSGIRGGLGLLAVVGALDQAANVALALAIQRGPLAVAAVLSSLYPAVTAVAAIVALSERPHRPEVLGIGLAVVAAVVLALPSG